MSSCINITVQRIGAVTTTATKEPDAITGVDCSAVGRIVPTLELQGRIYAAADVFPVTARVSHVCTPSIRHPYLEIEPEILWVYPDLESLNNVLSNTTWHIN